MTGLTWEVNKLRIATEAAGIALWSWNVDTDRVELDDRGYMHCGEFRTPERLRSKRFPPVFIPGTWTGYEPPLGEGKKSACDKLARRAYFCLPATQITGMSLPVPPDQRGVS